MPASLYGNAGCLLKYNGLLLAVRQKQTEKWDIPAGKPLPHETADQTAIRETYEETGLHVKTKRLLEDFGGQFFIYECQLCQALDLPIKKLSVPSTAYHEITEIAFLPIEELTPGNTAYPEVLPRIQALFKKLL